jgi:Mn-dependent DtxR family transcriptional regulator
LTEKGLAIAREIYERHNLVAKFLMSIGVSKETAFEDACKIEHDLSRESFEKIKEHFFSTGDE